MGQHRLGNTGLFSSQFLSLPKINCENNMKELPYFRFTVQEWQNGDISIMSDSCRGVFIDICAFYWAQNCNVTEKMLSKKFKTKSKLIQKLVESDSIKCQNGFVSISFLDEQILELNKNSMLFSEWGKLGQKAKKEKARLKPPLSQGLNYKDKDKENDKDKDKDKEELSTPVCSNPPKSESVEQYKNRISEWEISFIKNADILTDYQKAYPVVLIVSELKRAVLWLQNNPTKRKKNIDRFFQNWCARAQERGGTRAAAVTVPKSKDLTGYREK